MADTRITQLGEITVVTPDDYYVIVDGATSATKKVQAGNSLVDGGVTTAKIADGAVTPRKIATVFDCAYYSTASQALVATYTPAVLASSETAPAISLTTQSLVAVTLSGAFFTSTLAAYAKWVPRVSSDNSTFRDFTSAEQLLQSTNSLVEHTSFGQNTSERSGNPSFTRYYKLAAGTWYFQVGHVAGGSTGNINYGLVLSVCVQGSV